MLWLRTHDEFWVIYVTNYHLSLLALFFRDVQVCGVNKENV